MLVFLKPVNDKTTDNNTALTLATAKGHKNIVNMIVAFYKVFENISIAPKLGQKRGFGVEYFRYAAFFLRVRLAAEV